MGDDEKKYGDKETEIPGPANAKRGCRDILCVIIFLVVGFPAHSFSRVRSNSGGKSETRQWRRTGPHTAVRKWPW
jgi:hypothetical protein